MPPPGAECRGHGGVTTRPGVAIVADGLTGALDAAVRFRGTGDVVVVLHLGHIACVDAQVLAVDTASRDRGVPEACVLTQEAVVQLGRLQIPTVFKKMDSRLRGHFVEEIAAMLAAGPWSCAMVAPALPEQARVILNGQLQDGGTVGSSLLSAFQEGSAVRCRGVGLEAIRSGATSLHQVFSSLLRDETPVLVCDAEREEDLAMLVQVALEIRGRSSWLWCGSAGLAGALARSVSPNAPPPPSDVVMPFVGLIGSPDPMAQAQLRAAESHGVPVRILSRLADSGQDRALVEGARYHLERGDGIFLGAPSLGTGEKPTAVYANRLAAIAVELVGTGRPRSLVLSGGDTARKVCRALGIRGLRVAGEIAAGVPLSEALGPPQVHGLTVVTKAGSFGPTDLWRKLMRVH